MKSIFRTIIIDDESPARQRLKELLVPYSNSFLLVGEAENGRKGLNLINTLNPDLVFLDIQMPGMNGFELIEKLNHIPVIVFCTAYDQYSLEAFETNSIDYLIKPVSPERFEKTIEKLKRLSNKVTQNDLLKMLEQFSQHSKQPEMTSITIKRGNKLSFIKLDDIAYFEADEKYVKINNVNGESSITERSLKELEEKLPSTFIRIHRSTIVNKNLIGEVQTYFNSKYVFKLNDKNNSKLFSGRSFQSQIKEWIELG